MTDHPGTQNLAGEDFGADNPIMAVFDPALFERHAIDIHLFDQFWLHGQKAGFDLIAQLVASWNFVIEFKLFAFLFAFGASGFAGIVVFFLCQRGIHTVYGTQDKKHHTRLTMAQLAFMKTLVPTISLLAAFTVMRFFLYYNHIISPASEPFYKSLAIGLMMLVLLLSGSKVLLYPHSSRNALINDFITIPPSMARHLVRDLTVIGLFIYGHDALNKALSLVDAPSNFVSALNLLAIIFVGFAIWFLCPKHKAPKQALPFSRPLALFIVLGALLLALVGYVGLARLIVQVATVLAAFWPLIAITLIISHSCMCEGAFANSVIGRALIQRFGLNSIRLDQIGLAFGLAFGFLLLILIMVSILLLCGVSAALIGRSLLHLFTGFQIGSVFISPVSLLVGFMFFLSSLLLCRWLVKMFDGVILTHGHIDQGVRHSIRTVSGYVSLALAAIIGISAAGFNLSSLALIAGGLSLGIGFGMQNIVQNFVAGLILLTARPFKVGDFVEIGSVTGTVRKINVRATQIETLEKRAVIIPNSAFINSNVSNWTPHGPSGQITMSFTLPADGTPDDVLARLLNLVQNTPHVLPSPPPEGELTAFNAKEFTFSLYAHIVDIKAIHKVKTALNLAVFEHFFAQKQLDT